MSISKSRQFYRVLTVVLAVAILVFYLFPYWYVVTTSFRLPDEERAAPFVWFPNPVHLDNFKDILLKDAFDIMTGLKNSLIVSIATTLICAFLGVLAGYGYARIPFKGRQASIVLVLATWTIPWLLVLIPLWAILYELQLVDTKIGLIIGYSSGFVPITTWIMLGHFKSLPADMEDSARIDGCSRIGALMRIILPISTPAIMAAGVYAFISSMGEFIFTLITTMTNNARTLTIMLSMLVSKFVTQKTIMAAGSIIAAAFPVVLVMIFQRYLIAGLSAGAVKG
jgi:multiple sugar transport system permease protein